MEAYYMSFGHEQKKLGTTTLKPVQIGYAIIFGVALLICLTMIAVFTDDEQSNEQGPSFSASAEAPVQETIPASDTVPQATGFAVSQSGHTLKSSGNIEELLQKTGENGAEVDRIRSKGWCFNERNSGIQMSTYVYKIEDTPSFDIDSSKLSADRFSIEEGSIISITTAGIKKIEVYYVDENGNSHSRSTYQRIKTDGVNKIDTSSIGPIEPGERYALILLSN